MQDCQGNRKDGRMVVRMMKQEEPNQTINVAIHSKFNANLENGVVSSMLRKIALVLQKLQIK